MKSATPRRSILQSAAMPAINLIAAPSTKPKLVVAFKGILWMPEMSVKGK